MFFSDRSYIILLGALCVLAPSFVKSEEFPKAAEEQAALPSQGSAAPQKQASVLSNLIKDGFSYSTLALLSGTVQYPGNSTQNPDNAFLRISRYSAGLSFRPDFFLDLPSAGFVLKPRLTAGSEWREDGVADGERARESRAFLNEWLFQAKPHSALFLSYGKEKHLWGASFLANPSNFFFIDTEKANPKSELEGGYFTRLVYLPNNALTFTLISNVGDERNEREDGFRATHALKTEYMGDNYLLGLIGYEKRDDRMRIGGFGQWTASDSMILYFDGMVTRGSDARYPVQSAASPFGYEFDAKYEGSDRLFKTMVAGGGYTLLSGSTFTLEFLYNQQGYDDEEAKRYYELRQSASGAYFTAGPVSDLAQKTLFESYDTRMQFMRRYYLLAQFQLKEIQDVFSAIVRYTHSLEENSGIFASIVEWKLSDRVRLFNINNVSVDRGGRTEYNSMLDRSFMLGMEYHF